MKKEDTPLARPKLTILVDDTRAETSWCPADSFQFPKHASSSRAHLTVAPTSSFSSTAPSTTFTTSSRERIRIHRSSSSRNNSLSSSMQVSQSPVSLEPPPYLKTHLSTASQSSGSAMTPISPFVSRLSSFTSLLLSPLADVMRDPVKVSRETQLERLRAELSGRRHATTWLLPDSCGKCAYCTSSGTIEL